MEKRYAIVRVDRYPICPLGFKHKCEDFVKTGICDCKHGDTKEQLIAKVAQVINNFIIPQKLINAFEKEMLLKNYELHKKLAKEIVEFLGVK